MHDDGSRTVNTWDHAQRLITQTQSTGLGSYKFTYDPNGFGDLVTSVDPTGLRTDFTYEPNYRQLATVTLDPTPNSPNSGDERVSVTNVFDSTIAGAEGNPVSSSNALGETTTYTYTANGNVESVTSPRGNVTGADPTHFTTSFEYDATGAVT